MFGRRRGRERGKKRTRQPWLKYVAYPAALLAAMELKAQQSSHYFLRSNTCITDIHIHIHIHIYALDEYYFISISTSTELLSMVEDI
jgi:hypothetical protein